jgi:hypothetical protein
VSAFNALDKMLQLKRHKGAEYALKTELVIRKSTGQASAKAPREVASGDFRPALHSIHLAMQGNDRSSGTLPSVKAFPPPDSKVR